MYVVDNSLRCDYASWMLILKKHAIQAAKTGTALANVLGVTKQAVSKWPDVLPELYCYRLRARKPRWYAAAIRMSEADTQCAKAV